jgi:hypothetical protein
VICIFEEITISTDAFLVVLVLAALFGAKYIAAIAAAIISAVVGILRFLWWLIVIFVVCYAVYFVVSNISFS